MKHNCADSYMMCQQATPCSTQSQQAKIIRNCIPIMNIGRKHYSPPFNPVDHQMVSHHLHYLHDIRLERRGTGQRHQHQSQLKGIAFVRVASDKQPRALHRVKHPQQQLAGAIQRDVDLLCPCRLWVLTMAATVQRRSCRSGSCKRLHTSID